MGKHSQKILRIYQNPNIYQTRWTTLALTVIDYIRELFAQKSDGNGVHLYARKFTSEVSAAE